MSLKRILRQWYMRLLFISNFYPPLSIGGYEQWCQEVADGLRERGHQVEILTSRYDRGKKETPDPPWIHRSLFFEMEINSLAGNLRSLTAHRIRRNGNLKEIHRSVETIAPEAIVIWGMWNLSPDIPALAEQLRPEKVIYYLGDYWPLLPAQMETYWTIPARSWKTALPKRLLKPLALRVLTQGAKPGLFLNHAIFATKFLRDEYLRNGVPIKNETIIYGAVDTSPYIAIDKPTDQRHSRITLLYVGRLTQEKGVHTCIQALGMMSNSATNKPINLMIVGSGDSEYETYLRNLAMDKQVGEQVEFLGARPKSELPGIYRDGDIFLFPSIWPEPFGRVLVEAMAAGLPVIGTTVGGAAEILIDGVNGLTFTPDEPESLAAQITRLIEMPELRMRLADAGRKMAVEKFDLHRMVSEIEIYITSIVGG